VLLVLDAINAPFTAVSSERDQILRFLRAQGERLPVPTSLAVVTDTNVYVQPTSSTDGNALSAALERHALSLRMLRRSTGFYGASERANLSLRALTQLAAREGARPGRKLIFWVSPGWPLLSGPGVSLTATQQRQIYASVVQITTQLRQSRITLYALNAWGATEPLIRSEYYQGFTKPLVKPYEAEIGNMALQVFARQSGGLVVNSNDLGILLKRAFEDTSAYYEIVYDKPAAEQAEEFHPVEVRVDKPGLTVRTIHGYNSRP
jgi:VWFA-related protein